MREDGKMKEVSIFTAIGIDLDGRKSILGFWVRNEGESKSFWIEVLQDLIARGTKRVLLFVTDDFSGLKEVMARLFPYSDHQLCYIHMQRNLKKHLSDSLYKAIRSKLYLARKAATAEEGGGIFDGICDAVASENGEFAERMSGRKGNYLAFLKYPQEARIHLYTTNAVESVNAGLELMRCDLGGYFPSMASLDVNYFVQIEYRNDRWLRKPVPDISRCAYELRQMFALRFELNEMEI